MKDQLSDDQREKMLQFMATEHSVLQAGRSATIFETGGRTAVFLGTVLLYFAAAHWRQRLGGGGRRRGPRAARSRITSRWRLSGRSRGLARRSSRSPLCCCPRCSSWAW